MAVTRQADYRYKNVPGLKKMGALEAAKRAQQERRMEQLKNSRQEQIGLAVTYVMYGKPSLDIKKDGVEQSVEGQVFLASLAAFEAAEKVTDRSGKSVKGAIQVALEMAAEQDKAGLFANPETADAALRGSEWANRALKWAGRQLFDKKKEAPKQA